MKRVISGIFMTLLAGTVMGCATSGHLAKVEERQNQIAAKADQALQEAQSARAAADAAQRQAEAANAAATRAETTASAATAGRSSATGGPIQENPTYQDQGRPVQETPAYQNQQRPVNQTPQRSDTFQRSMEK